MPDSILDSKPRCLTDIQKSQLEMPNLREVSKAYVGEAKKLRDQYIGSTIRYVKLLEKDGIKDPEQLLRNLDSASSFNELPEESKSQVMGLLEKEKDLRSELPVLQEEASLITKSKKMVSDKAYEIFTDYINDKSLTAINSTSKLETIVSKLNSDLEASVPTQDRINLTHLLRISKQILERFQVYDIRFEKAMENGFDIKKQFIQVSILDPTKKSGYNRLINPIPSNREFENFIKLDDSIVSIESIYALLDRRANAIGTGFYEEGKYNIWNADSFFNYLVTGNPREMSSSDVINTIRAADHLTNTGDVRLDSTRIPSITPRHANIHTLAFTSQEDTSESPVWMSFYRELKNNNSIKSAISNLLLLPQAEKFQTSVDFPEGIIKNDPNSAPIIAFIIKGRRLNPEIRLTAERHKDLLIEAVPKLEAENVICLEHPSEEEFNEKLKTLSAKIDKLNLHSSRAPEIILIYAGHGLSYPDTGVPKPFQNFQGSDLGQLFIGKDFEPYETKINEALKPIAEKAKVFFINGSCHSGAWLY